MKRGPIIRALYYLGAGLWALFAVIALGLNFVASDQSPKGWNPVLDFRFSAGDILIGIIRPIAFLTSSFVCIGVSAWLFVMGMIREDR